MNRSAYAKALAAKMNAQPEALAIEVYEGLRRRVMGDRKAGARTPSSISAAMVAAGEALETRIGDDRFDAIIDRVDAEIYGAAA